MAVIVLFVKPSSTCPGRPTGLCNVNVVGYGSLSSMTVIQGRDKILFVLPLSLHTHTHLQHLADTIISITEQLRVLLSGGSLTVLGFELMTFWSRGQHFNYRATMNTSVSTPECPSAEMKHPDWANDWPLSKLFLRPVVIFPWCRVVPSCLEPSRYSDSLMHFLSVTWYDGDLHAHHDEAECQSGCRLMPFSFTARKEVSHARMTVDVINEGVICGMPVCQVSHASSSFFLGS